MPQPNALIADDFKPASVDTTKMATVDILPNNEVNVTVPHCDGAGATQTSVFRGPKKSYAKECVLIIDHNTGEITLERLSHNIQLKKTRLSVYFISITINLNIFCEEWRVSANQMPHYPQMTHYMDKVHKRSVHLLCRNHHLQHHFPHHCQHHSGNVTKCSFASYFY